MSYGLGIPTESYIGQYIVTPNARSRPPEGVRTLWAQLIWNNATGQKLGSGVVLQVPLHLVGTLSQISSIFIDNSQSTTDIIIVFPDTGQTIWVPSGYQSLYPVFTNSTYCTVYQLNPDILSTTAVYFINQYETPFVSRPKGSFSLLSGLNTNGVYITTFSGSSSSPDWPGLFFGSAGSLSAIKIDYVATCINANDILALELVDNGNNNRIYNSQTLSPAANTQFSRYDFVTGLTAKWGSQGLKLAASTNSGGAYNFILCSLGIYL